MGADACNDTAVAKIFEAKGRPTFNPLIVHVKNQSAAEQHATFNTLAKKIAAKFWPGALSLVLPKSRHSEVSTLATAGLDTIALRNPTHPAALALLDQLDRPIAAPSANPSGLLSPTTAEHVAQFLGPTVSLVLDGGPCPIGVESTIIDLTSKIPVLLRPGGVTVEKIIPATGALDPAEQDKIVAPGMLKSHYSPKTPIRMNATHCVAGEALLAFGPKPLVGSKYQENLSPSGNLIEAAGNLFRMLHRLDDTQSSGIAVMPIPSEGLGLAINDRLQRACS